MKDLYNAGRRRRMKHRGLCINGAFHGKAIAGVLCAWCRAVHRMGVVRAEKSGIERPIASFRRQG